MKNTSSLTALWFLLALSIIFYCYEFFLRISPSVAVGPLMQYFQLNAFGISKLLAVFYLAYTLGQIPAGLLLDRFSVRLVLMFATLICAIGVYLFITPNHHATWLGRFLIGFASSFAFIAVLKIARAYLPSKYFTRIVGITVSIGTIVAAYGNVLASYFIQGDFKFIFIISIIWGLLLALGFGLFYYFFEAHPHEHKAQVHAFSSTDILALIKNYPLWLNALVGGLFYLPTTVLGDVWGDYFLHSKYQFSLTQSSYVITWLFIGWMLGSPFMGYLADRFKNVRTIITISALLSALILFHILFLATGSVNILCSLMLALGITSSAQLVVWRIFNQLAPLNLAATGIALTNMVIMLTSAVGQTLIGFLLSRHQNSYNINLYTHVDYHQSLMILPFALIMAAVLVRLLPKSKGSRQ